MGFGVSRTAAAIEAGVGTLSGGWRMKVGHRSSTYIHEGACDFKTFCFRPARFVPRHVVEPGHVAAGRAYQPSRSGATEVDVHTYSTWNELYVCGLFVSVVRGEVADGVHPEPEDLHLPAGLARHQVPGRRVHQHHPLREPQAQVIQRKLGESMPCIHSKAFFDGWKCMCTCSPTL